MSKSDIQPNVPGWQPGDTRTYEFYGIRVVATCHTTEPRAETAIWGLTIPAKRETYYWTLEATAFGLTTSEEYFSARDLEDEAEQLAADLVIRTIKEGNARLEERCVWVHDDEPGLVFDTAQELDGYFLSRGWPITRLNGDEGVYRQMSYAEWRKEQGR